MLGGKRTKEAMNTKTGTVQVKAPVYRGGKVVARIRVGRALPRKDGGFVVFLDAFPVSAEASFFVDEATPGRYRVSVPREGEDKTFWVPVGTAFVKETKSEEGQKGYMVSLAFDAVPYEGRLLVGDRALDKENEDEGDEPEPEAGDPDEDLDVPWE